MGAKDRVLIELLVDDQGVVKIRQATAATKELADVSTRGSADSRAAADDFAGALTRQLGLYALLAAGVYGLERAIVGGFKAGIAAADEYNLITIGVAATLTDLAKDQKNLPGVFSQNLAYAQGMYNDLELAAAKYFASGKEMTQAWNILAQKGIVLRHEEIDALGVITDRIKLSTMGQASGLQIAQEMRGLLEGQVRQQSQVAMLLKDRIPNLEQEVQLHRHQGDLVVWLADQFKGLGVASGYIENTLESQRSTLGTLLSQVGRTGLAGAYEDIVGWLKQANEYITEHKAEITGGVARGWMAVKDLVAGVHGFIVEIANLANKGIVVPITFGIGGPAKWLAEGMGGGSYRIGGMPGDAARNELINIAPEASFGFGAMLPEMQTPAPPGAGGRYSRLSDIKTNLEMRRIQTGSEKFFMLPNGDIVPMSVIADAADVRDLAGDTGGGGKGLEAEANRRMSIYDTLTKDIARLSEGSLAEVEANLEKTIDQIYKKIEHRVTSEAELEVMARQRAGLQKEKIEEDFWDRMAKESGDAFAQINRDYQKDLKNAQQILGGKEALLNNWHKRVGEMDQKQQTDLLSLQKSQLDSLAGALPFLSQQLAVKERILPLEAELGRLTLEKKIQEMEATDESRKRLGLAPLLNDALKDELRGLQALEAQLKKNALEMERNKGLSGWAFGRAKEADQRNTIKDLMGTAENAFANAFSSGLQGVLSHDKKSLQDIGKTMFQGFLGEIHKGGINRAFESFAKLIAPSRDRGAKGDLSGAGELLNSAGLQLLTSAGGLALSAIGIMTKSEALVYAGTVLQLAGLAIQIYQALTATTQMTAAAALTLAAGELSVAAWMLMASGAMPFFHGGGVVAHQGLLVAHNGLALDERLIVAQTGEGILQRSAMAAYARQGVSFDMLNSGRLPALPAPVGVPQAGSGGPSHIRLTLPIIVQSPDGKTLFEDTKELVVDLVNQRAGKREIRIPYTAVTGKPRGRR